MALDIYNIIPGSGRSFAASSGANTPDTIAMGANTLAVQLSVITGNCLVTLSNAGSKAATATKDVLLKMSDPPIRLKCAPGDKVSVWGLAAGTLYIVECG
jgi:hypothetical protein